MTKAQRRVYDQLGSEPLTTEELALAAGVSQNSAYQHLMALKQKDFVQRMNRGSGKPVRWRRA